MQYRHADSLRDTLEKVHSVLHRAIELSDRLDQSDASQMDPQQRKAEDDLFTHLYNEEPDSPQFRQMWERRNRFQASNSLVDEFSRFESEDALALANNSDLHGSRELPHKRPFVINRNDDRETHPLHALERALFSHVLRSLSQDREPTFIFPAPGHDRRYFHNRPTVFIEPSSPASDAAIREHFQTASEPLHRYVRSKIQDTPTEAIHRSVREVAHEAENTQDPFDRLLPRRGVGPNVLILKGVQTLVEPQELTARLSRWKPEFIVAFGCAGKHFGPQARVAFPSLGPKEHQAVQKAGYEDVTAHYLSPGERSLMQRIHAQLENHFLFQGGHFPASRVRVYALKNEPATRGTSNTGRPSTRSRIVAPARKP